MAKHEFGIMDKEPITTERFDEYVPKKFKCIAIDDDFIEIILTDLEKVNCYWHTRLIEGKGLAYCGTTLIPPQSIDTFIEVLLNQDNVNYNDLIFLANKAKKQNKYIIHFGI